MTPETVEHLLKDTLKEAVEAFCYLYVILLISERPIDLPRILRISLMLGVIQTAMAYFDEEGHVKIKEGMKASVGNSVITSAIRK